MADRLIRRTIKDTVFTNLFSDLKYVYELYRSLHPEDTTITQDDIGIVTLEPVLTNAIYNDLGFTAGNQLVMLVEAQSTWSPNIIIRCLLYLAETYKIWLDQTEQSVYGRENVKIPRPEFYVIYTGESKITKDVISFSEEFCCGACTDLDVKVHIIRDGQNGDIISQYVTFTKIANEVIEEFGRTQIAAEEILQRCIKAQILPDYMESKRMEVIDIMMTLFSDAEVQRAFMRSERKEAEMIGIEKGRTVGRREGRAEGRKEGRAEGRKEGRAEGRKEEAEKFLAKMRSAGLSEEQIKAILNASV